MAGKLKLTYLDFSEEVAWVGFEGATLTALNFDAQVDLQDALVTATEAIIMSSNFKKERVASIERGFRVAPMDKDAQRERKWRVSYEDTTTHMLYSLDLPCADLQYLKDNSDEADLENVTVAAFVTAFTAYVKSPDGNAVAVRKITHVGRRS